MLYRIASITLLLLYAIALPLHILGDVDHEHLQLSHAFNAQLAGWTAERAPAEMQRDPRLASILSRVSLARMCNVPSAVREFGRDVTCAQFANLSKYESKAVIMLVFSLLTLGLLSVLISGMRNLRRIRSTAALAFYFVGMTMGGTMTLGSTTLWLTYFFSVKRSEWHVDPLPAAACALLLCGGAAYLALRVHRRLRLLGRSVAAGRWTEVGARTAPTAKILQIDRGPRGSSSPTSTQLDDATKKREVA